MKEIQFDETVQKFASEWHGGQNSMLYAIASTGKLAIGSEGFRRGRPDVVWLYDLVLALADELVSNQVHFYGEDLKIFRSISGKLNMFIKNNRRIYEEWHYWADEDCALALFQETAGFSGTLTPCPGF